MEEEVRWDDSRTPGRCRNTFYGPEKWGPEGRDHWDHGEDRGRGNHGLWTFLV